MGLSAIGTSQFLLGFQLAGVSETVLANKENVLERIKESKSQIIILDDSLLSDLDSYQREELETSPDPVIITIGKSGEEHQERLRRAVKNTLGVDLL